MVIETFSPEETEELGIHFGKEAKPGTVCTLIGDLGVGKTVFTQGIAKGLGDIEEMDEIGYEDYFYGDGLTMIEWANLIEEILPEHYQQITIEKDIEKGFDYRKITIESI